MRMSCICLIQIKYMFCSVLILCTPTYIIHRNSRNIYDEHFFSSLSLSIFLNTPFLIYITILTLIYLFVNINLNDFDELWSTKSHLLTMVVHFLGYLTCFFIYVVNVLCYHILILDFETNKYSLNQSA